MDELIVSCESRYRRLEGFASDIANDVSLFKDGVAQMRIHCLTQARTRKWMLPTSARTYLLLGIKAPPKESRKIFFPETFVGNMQSVLKPNRVVHYSANI
jgi:hypothetical protein